jgi:hypothetical protein
VSWKKFAGNRAGTTVQKGQCEMAILEHIASGCWYSISRESIVSVSCVQNSVVAAPCCAAKYYHNSNTVWA